MDKTAKLRNHRITGAIASFEAFCANKVSISSDSILKRNGFTLRYWMRNIAWKDEPEHSEMLVARGSNHEQNMGKGIHIFKVYRTKNTDACYGKTKQA